MRTYTVAWRDSGTARDWLADMAAARVPLVMKLKLNGPAQPGDMIEVEGERLRLAVIRPATEAEHQQVLEQFPGPDRLPWSRWIVCPLGIDHLAMTEARRIIARVPVSGHSEAAMRKAKARANAKRDELLKEGS